jgi:integrase
VSNEAAASVCTASSPGRASGLGGLSDDHARQTQHTPLNSFSECKAEFDAGLSGMPPWVIHDLRRTARSLMSRANVRPDIAERVLGHAIPGVEGVYDRHHYADEKADALQRLASLVETIVNPPEGNVVALLR